MTINLATLNSRLATAGKTQIVCPVCGEKDNDWPERNGLCCSCWCSAWLMLSDAAAMTKQSTPDDREMALTPSEGRAIIAALMRDDAQFAVLKEAILEARRRSGTLLPPGYSTRSAAWKAEYARRYRERNHLREQARKRAYYQAHKLEYLERKRRLREAKRKAKMEAGQ